MGPAISDADISKLYKQLDGLQDGDVLVLAGSIPSVMPATIYRDIMSHLAGKNLRIVVDATKDLLRNVLEFHPFLIKPNNHELGEIYGVPLNTRDEVIPYARKLQEEGARNVLISMAQGKVKNSVGAGDSMVAGFIAGYLASGDYEQAFYMGVCTGSASAFSDGMATREAVQGLLGQFGKKYL